MIIVALRGDGFGARICAIANGLAVAERLGLPFWFSWPQMKTDGDFHAIAPPEAIFSADFLAKHLDQTLAPRDYVGVMDAPITSGIMSEAQEKSGIAVNHWNGPVVIEGKPNQSAGEVAASFQKIEFSDRIKAAMKAGHDAIKGPSVAVHARRGDIVYGEYRKRLFNRKYMPLAAVKTIIRRLTEQNRKVIFFSDDVPTIDNLKRQFGIGTASELRPNGGTTNEESAVFDMALMSKCETIIASRSVFTVAASMMGDVPMIEVMDYAAKADARNGILEDILLFPDHYSVLEKAKSYQWVANELKDVISAQERNTLLAQAGALDPENHTYQHIRVVDYLRRKIPVKAETILRESALQCFQQSERSRLDVAPSYPSVQNHFPKFLRYSMDARFPYLNLICALHFRWEGDKDKAAEHSAMAYRAERSALAGGIYVLDLVQAGRVDEAREVMQTLSAAYPGVPAVMYANGVTWEAQGNKRRAYKSFLSAYELSPKDEVIAASAAFFAMRCASHEIAADILPKFPPKVLKIGTAAIAFSKASDRLGDMGLAKAYAEHAVFLEPKRKKFREYLAGLTVT